MLSPASIQFLKALSRLLGWIYTISWSLSFYPQPLLNYRRRSTTGTSPTFPTLNVLGFSCYTISTLSLYYSPLIRQQYIQRNHGEENTVRFNDVAFVVHALVLSWLTYSMFWHGLWGFERRSWRLGKVIWAIIIGCMIGVAWVVVTVTWKGKDGGRDPEGWAWIDVVYAVGYVKLIVTIPKYIPQAWANYKRKSTVGWSIDQILMDALGSVLSIAQLVIDSSLQSDWSGLVGNPVKFGLGNVSIVFNAIFIVQHYVLYRGNDKVNEEDVNGERTGLLASDDEEAALR